MRTPMIAPTTVYRDAPALSAERSARGVMQALLTRERTVSTLFGTWAAIAYAIAPSVGDRVASPVYRIVHEGTPPDAPPSSGPQPHRRSTSRNASVGHRPALPWW